MSDLWHYWQTQRFFPEPFLGIFSIPPAKETDLHRKAPGEEELRKIFRIETKRYLGNDGVIRHNNRFYQIENITSRRVKAVIVEDRLDGSMHVRNNGTYFNYREIDPKLIRRSETTKKVRNRTRKVYIPPKDHPWRRFKIKSYSPLNNYKQK